MRRIYPMRNLGVLLLCVPYVSVLLEQGSLGRHAVLVALNVLVWPHVAFALALRARDPIAAEHRNLVADAAFGGFWIAATHFSLVPATAMLSILAADRLAAGGWRLLGRASLACVLVLLLTGWAVGWRFEPIASTRTIACSLPPIFIYMLALSHVGYQLARRIAQQNRQLDRLNLTDPGVDLPNRRFFNARAQDMVASARASSAATPAVLLMLDVDGFKAINDRHGHVAGDEVLREIARLLREQAGTTGFPARLGGDEFALLLGASLTEGERVAAELREGVAMLRLPNWPQLHVGVSIGVAPLASHHRGMDEWLGAADRAMYVAKASARLRR
ncbi:diguanylate cyclase [Stenotrophomonas sp. HITSZ_GD]|uniref:diguanylate cyclase n=1 Tax=Stenotrophomonas sp. HITSZ_GD TaxID=3037248 RepID=UPI00240D020A|nr:diguanylate cyclase [Stenotrophomonas sp. HITSZ_GD]MDG2524800.1 diguanylate cyclase [Stenotrophomonas sp. HITSZ_GD]